MRSANLPIIKYRHLILCTDSNLKRRYGAALFLYPLMTDLTMKQIEAWIEELTQKSQELQRFHNILFSSDMIDTMKVSIYEERIRYLKGQLLKMKG